MDMMVLTDLHHLHQRNKLNLVFSSFNINVSDYGPKVKMCSVQSKVKERTECCSEYLKRKSKTDT